MSKEVSYVIEGERWPLRAIKKECPKIGESTISSRLRAGVRTWAELRSPKRIICGVDFRLVRSRCAVEQTIDHAARSWPRADRGATELRGLL